MYVLLTKKIPFFGKDDKEVRKSIIRKKYNPEPIRCFSQYVQDLIADLLEKDYDKRLNAEKALTYEIFKVYQCKEAINKVDLKQIKSYVENIKRYKRNNIFQETAISYLIHNCDIDDVPIILQLFNLFDVNDNGKIGFTEFYDGLVKICGENITREEGRKIFLNLDSDKNNYIEQEEFVKAGVDKKVFLSDKMLKLAFDFFDIDNSGLITVEDIIQLFKDNVKINKEASSEFQKIIQTIDKNEKGKIDYEQFSIFMKNLLEQL
jgi:Ca2+-binding EF-hand superfamily protein